MAVADVCRLMVIFSVGGLGLTARGASRALRCQPSVLTIGDPPAIVLDPFPAAGLRGVVGEGRARVMRGDAEVEAGRVRVSLPRRRWDDLDVLRLAASTLSSWVVLPAMLEDPALDVRDLGPSAGGLRRVEVTVPGAWPLPDGGRHVLHLDPEGLVHRHDEGRFVHLLAGHCDFGGTTVATRRRTYLGRAGAWFTVLWADVVAAHVLPPATPTNRSMNGPDLPTPQR